MGAFRINLAKGLLTLFALLVLIACIAAFRTAVRQPFHLDEAEEALMGLKMSRIGPRAFLAVPGGGMPVTHPLLYTFTQAAVQRVFGPGEFPLRMYGVFHFVVSLILLLAIINELLKEDRFLKNIGMGIGALLYIINPLLIQHSVVINADNNILTTTILVFIYFFVRFEKFDGDRFFYSRFLLGLLLALCFWAKELAPAFIFFGILVYRLINREFGKFICEVVLIGMVGLAVFWVTWWIYCAATGTDVLGFIKYTIIGKSKRAFSRSYLSDISNMVFYGSRWNIYWASVPFFVSLAAVFVRRAGSFITDRRLNSTDLIFICAITAWVPFQFFRPTIDMVKYQYPTYPLFIAVIACVSVGAIRARARKLNGRYICGNDAVLLFALTAVLTFHYYAIGDYLLVLWKPLTRHLNSHFLTYYYLPLAIIAVTVVVVSKRAVIWNNLFLSAVIFIVPVNLGLDLNHAKAKYATFEIWLNYGEAGLRDTAEYLKANVKNGGIVAVRYDLEYYLIHRYGLNVKNAVCPEKLFRTTDNVVVNRLFSEIPIQYFVVDHVSATASLNPDLPQLIERYFIFDRQIGDFYIYRRRG